MWWLELLMLFYQPSHLCGCGIMFKSCFRVNSQNNSDLSWKNSRPPYLLFQWHLRVFINRCSLLSCHHDDTESPVMFKCLSHMMRSEQTIKTVRRSWKLWKNACDCLFLFFLFFVKLLSHWMVVFVFSTEIKNFLKVSIPKHNLMVKMICSLKRK